MGGVLKAVTGMFSAPKIDTPKPKAVAPDPESAAARLAAKKKVESRRRDGRSGTIYSGAYGTQNLAGTQ